MLIIDDVVMPNVGASWKQTSMDLAMMSMLAAKERTEEEFRILLGSVGLRVRECVRYDEEYGDSLILAVRTSGGEGGFEAAAGGGGDGMVNGA